MKDGIYFEMFAVKDGVRYNAKIIDAKEVSERIKSAAALLNFFILFLLTFSFFVFRYDDT